MKIAAKPFRSQNHRFFISYSGHFSLTYLFEILMMFTLLTSADTHIGRFDPAMLTDQQLMELFFTPDDRRSQNYGEFADPDDVCSWDGVTCTNDGTVQNISWSSVFCRIIGTIDFLKMPQHMIELTFFDAELSGEINTSSLPQSLFRFCVRGCNFHGSLDVSQLPRGLCSFGVSANSITAVSSIVNLPSTILEFIICEEFLDTKSIHIGKLPSPCGRIEISGCGFEKVTFEDPEDAKNVLCD